MTSAVIERAKVQANMMQARKPELANMVPVTNGSNKQYVCVMSEDQTYDMRTADTNGWAKYQAAAAGAEGRNNPIFKGGLGLINDVVLHCHRNVVRFSDYGLGGNVAAARALFMGRQAAVIAYGTAKTHKCAMTGKKKWPTLAMSQKSRQASLLASRKRALTAKTSVLSALILLPKTLMLPNK